MQKYTHIIVGATAAALVIAFVSPELKGTLLSQFQNLMNLSRYGSTWQVQLALSGSVPALVAGGFFGILPDLDQILKREKVMHRSGLLHSILTLIWLPLVIGFIVPQYFAVATAAIFSHWFIDSFNPTGVRTLPYILPRKQESLKDFLWNHERDLRIAKLRYDNHAVNVVLCGICTLVIAYFALSWQAEGGGILGSLLPHISQLLNVTL
ncbi:MAG: metal-dependent hydrolase [Candidatus Jordarchaeales archaeon]|nr:metal-dependent hydrolase [Candidatus Jordarchaeia archaeon]